MTNLMDDYYFFKSLSKDIKIYKVKKKKKNILDEEIESLIQKRTEAKKNKEYHLFSY